MFLLEQEIQPSLSNAASSVLSRETHKLEYYLEHPEELKKLYNEVKQKYYQHDKHVEGEKVDEAFLGTMAKMAAYPLQKMWYWWVSFVDRTYEGLFAKKMANKRIKNYKTGQFFKEEDYRVLYRLALTLLTISYIISFVSPFLSWTVLAYMFEKASTLMGHVAERIAEVMGTSSIF